MDSTNQCKEMVYVREKYRRTGRTKSGFEMNYERRQCRRRATKDGYCWQHPWGKVWWKNPLGLGAWSYSERGEVMARTKRDDLMERVRAARALVSSCPTEKVRQDLELEAFMGIFHPEKQANRRYMNELKAARKVK